MTVFINITLSCLGSWKGRSSLGGANLTKNWIFDRFFDDFVEKAKIPHKLQQQTVVLTVVLGRDPRSIRESRFIEKTVVKKTP